MLYLLCISFEVRHYDFKVRGQLQKLFVIYLALVSFELENQTDWSAISWRQNSIFLTAKSRLRDSVEFRRIESKQ